MSTRTYGGRTAEQIKAAAQAATPGPWETHPRGGMGYDVDPVESGLRGMVDRAEDAAHIAASNPAAVLEMLARIAELEAERDATSAALRGYPDSDLASLATTLVGRVAALEGALARLVKAVGAQAVAEHKYREWCDTYPHANDRLADAAVDAITETMEATTIARALLEEAADA